MTIRSTSIALAALLVTGCEEVTRPETGPIEPPRFSIVIGTETQITSDPAAQHSPAISGDRIVWMDARNGNGDIYLLDLGTGAELQITTDPSLQWFPAISGDRIVWTDERAGQGNLARRDLYLFDLASHTETRVTPSPRHIFSNPPAISGNRIVWSDDSWGSSHLFLYDASTGETMRLPLGSPVLDPAISADRIAYTRQMDLVIGNLDIFMFDLATGTDTRITNHPADQRDAAISGDRIVWTDYRNERLTGWPDIYMFDLVTGTETRITGDEARVLRYRKAAISGDRIVWEDLRNGNIDIYMFDLAAGVEVRVTNSPGHEGGPAISGDRIVWTDTRTGNSDIFMFEISVIVDHRITYITQLVDGFVADGSIDNAGIAEVLYAFLGQAGAALAEGNGGAAARTLDRFIRFVEVQSGKHIAPAAAQALIQQAQLVIEEDLTPLIQPARGQEGTAFTITDPQGRMQPGDVAVFYESGAHPSSGFAALETTISEDGMSLSGLVPSIGRQIPVAGIQFMVIVLPGGNGQQRFEALGFLILPPPVPCDPFTGC